MEGCKKVSPEPCLLQNEQAQIPQPLFIGEVLQPSDALCSPPLDPFQQLHATMTACSFSTLGYISLGPIDMYKCISGGTPHIRLS